MSGVSACETKLAVTTRKQYSAEEKIRIVLDGLRGEHSIAELCRREGIAESLYYSWSKDSLRQANGALRATPRGRQPAAR
jgi:transposase-like protein